MKVRIGGGAVVSDPVRYLLAAVMERAMLDLRAFGRPLPPPTWHTDMSEGVTDLSFGCDCDARDALRWLTGYGADWCELLDVPREWAQQAMAERMIAQEAATA